jgi:hypothetical protein
VTVVPFLGTYHAPRKCTCGEWALSTGYCIECQEEEDYYEEQRQNRTDSWKKWDAEAQRSDDQRKERDL